VSASTAAALLQAELALRGVAWPAPIVALDSVGSTNEWLKETARHGGREWTTVLAAVQTAGRGRDGRAWVSPAGNLFLSTLLRPRMAPERLTLLPLAAGVAVAEALDHWSVPSRLKWPNDVRVGERKLGGILAEATSAAKGVDAVALGIGVNVQLRAEDVPAELRDTVTSVLLETGAAPAVAAVAAAILQRLAVWYDAVTARGAAAVLPAWRERSLAWWGRDVEVRCGAETVRGLARDVDDTGALVLEMKGGAKRTIFAGDARLFRAS
jgi:BirA family biotin operon repressor/biotin-[acetyl-CoA-carboxylase] ligase